MAKLPSLPENAHIADLFAAFPQSRDAMMAFTDVVMRHEGALDIATRELIAAYVSGLNRCTFCYGSHAIYAEAFGIEAGLLQALLGDLSTAPVAQDLRVLLGYLGKLNALPPRIVQADIDAVLAAGWSEQALFDAVQIAGLFNMMNRIIEGTGVSYEYHAGDEVHPAVRLGKDVTTHSYSGVPMGRGAAK
ncbi:MAG: peroxidase [Silicimonas sp.]|nr:peroxidase [Silicimonas sp.]